MIVLQLKNELLDSYVLNNFINEEVECEHMSQINDIEWRYDLGFIGFY